MLWRRLQHTVVYLVIFFSFDDDMRAVCNPVFEKRSFWVPGEPIHLFTYRGDQSMELYDTVRHCYPGFPVAIRHNTMVGFGMS